MLSSVRNVGRVATFLGAALLVGCGRGDAPAPRVRPAPMVTVAKVTTRDVPVTIRAPVELRPFLQADVGSKTLGYLDAVLFSPSDTVKKGQVLALVRPSDLPDQLTAARGSLAQAQATAALARANAARASSLAPSGVVSQQELQQAQAGLASAEAEEAAARAQVSVFAARVGETRITAPFDGVVLLRRSDPGALVGPGNGVIATVANLDVMKVFVSVDERRGLLAKNGQRAELTIDGLPDRHWDGSVYRVYSLLDQATRTMDIDIRVKNEDGTLKPGMFGRATIFTSVHPSSIVVPASAVLVSGGKRWAFVLEGDKVRRREVTLGVDEGDTLEITKGLQPTDEVVTAGMDNVSDGTVVRVSRASIVADSGATK